MKGTFAGQLLIFAAIAVLFVLASLQLSGHYDVMARLSGLG
jgi:hypothetical protein